MIEQGPVIQKATSSIQDQWNFCGQNYKDVDKDFCSDIIQIMKCFALERQNFNLSCQAERTKINSRSDFNPGLALIAF